MSGSAYEALDPDDDDPIWNDFHRMADEKDKVLSRLLAEIHEFEKGPKRRNPLRQRVDPEKGNDVDEVYLIQAGYEDDDSSALMGVQHDTKTIHYIVILEQLHSKEDDPAQWSQIALIAAAWRVTAKEKRAMACQTKKRP